MQEMICLNCGDRGFTNAFVYCVKCLKVAVHRYCLDILPNTVGEFVRWVCDDCDVEVQNQPAVCKQDAVQCKTRDYSTYKHVQVLECNMDGNFGGEHDLDFEDNNVQNVKQESNITQEMAWRRMIVRHSGHWEKSEYKDGDEQLLYMAEEHLCRDYLLREIHEIMQTDPTTADYLLFYTTSTSDGRRIKVSLKSDSDLTRLLEEQNEELVVYVIEKTTVLNSQRSRVLPHINVSGPSMVVDDNIRHQDPIGDNDLSHEDPIGHNNLSHEDETVSMDEDEDEDEEDNCPTELFDSLITEFSGWVREPGRVDSLLSSKIDRGVLNFSSDNAIDADAEGCAANDVADMTSQSELRNWVIPMANFNNAVPLAWAEPSVANIGALFVGAIFRRKDDLSIAVGMHHMQNRVEYSVYRSSSKRLQFVCKHGNGCPFMLRAVARDGIWIVYKLDINHTCHMDLSRTPPLQVSTRVIAAYFARKLVNEGNVLKPKDMMLEMNTFGQPDDLIIVSDQQESIKNAVKTVFPGVVHGLCYYHLRNKMAKYGTHVTTIFQNAAYSYRAEEFQKNMSALEVLSKGKAYKSLCSIGAERWSRSQCPIRRFSFMTSNAAMILNAHLLWARKLPICSLLEVFRTVIEKWFKERRAATILSDHVLTEEAMAKLSKSVEHGRCLTACATTSNLWKVEVNKISFMVDLQHRTCDCREFDLDLIPCCHAATAIRHAGLSIYEFVGHYYKQATLALTYKSEIFPLPHPDEWIVPASVLSVTVRAPLIDCHGGRSRMSRAQLGAESSSSRREQVCSRCQGSGHNIRACKAYVPISGVDLNASFEVAQPTIARKRQPKKCSICHETGHTRTKCPMLARGNSD
ncbi:hypothetical protein C2S51_004154 [Perilla frutescens var. frutescens]|nr:hypothetical protein C2S51_004154 [Perilla frutescens var. frutescens]